MSVFPDEQHSASQADGHGHSPANPRQIIVIDGDNVFPWSSIADSLSSCPELSIERHAKLDEWLTSPAFSSDAVVLLCFRSQSQSVIPEFIKLDCSFLRGHPSGLTYALIADRDGALELSTLLSLGVRGFLSADLPAKIFVQALALISRGSRFFTASCFAAEDSK